ncbi:MAG TPA: divalent-cation tolerance protein CutA [Spirochaetes bacterium]|nr:divalent-cation tolerance protein CutA [Spirochaetota bacterium]
MSDYIQITTTTENKEQAVVIAEKLVKLRLAACVQISGPVKSIFWWKNKVEKADEWICTAKSKSNLYKKIEKTILEIHPYEVPEIIAVPIVNGSNEYLKWIDEESAKDK